MRPPGRAPAAATAMLAAVLAIAPAARAVAPADPVAPPAPAAAGRLRPADDPSTVLVVANASVPASLRLASEYAAAREIPPANIVRLEAPAREEIDRDTFETVVMRPIQDHLW